MGKFDSLRRYGVKYTDYTVAYLDLLNWAAVLYILVCPTLISQYVAIIYISLMINVSQKNVDGDNVEHVKWWKNGAH